MPPEIFFGIIASRGIMVLMMSVPHQLMKLMMEISLLAVLTIHGEFTPGILQFGDLIHTAISSGLNIILEIGMSLKVFLPWKLPTGEPSAFLRLSIFLMA